mmetsp:Transcript_45165/g.125286  ORF Transcript_45165/g.125286 Transcript_45165/m.125286 type:complete len:209 (-) Transcript_45165:1957-2583(-)
MSHYTCDDAGCQCSWWRDALVGGPVPNCAHCEGMSLCCLWRLHGWYRRRSFAMWAQLDVSSFCEPVRSGECIGSFAGGEHAPVASRHAGGRITFCNSDSWTEYSRRSRRTRGAHNACLTVWSVFHWPSGYELASRGRTVIGMALRSAASFRARFLPCLDQASVGLASSRLDQFPCPWILVGNSEFFSNLSIDCCHEHLWLCPYNLPAN